MRRCDRILRVGDIDADLGHAVSGLEETLRRFERHQHQAARKLRQAGVEDYADREGALARHAAERRAGQLRAEQGYGVADGKVQARRKLKPYGDLVIGEIVSRARNDMAGIGGLGFEIL